MTSRLVIFRRHPLFMAFLVVGILLLAWGLYMYLDVSWRYRDRVRTPETLEPRPVALIFGAGVYPDGRLSPMLADRVETGVSLYRAGKVQKLLMSGDNRVLTYNEPWHMGDYAVAHGVPESALAFDYAGRRTYDSCWRAKHIFGLEEVVVVTQGFHLPRALYLCQSMGLDAVGVAADRRAYPRRVLVWLHLREVLARIWAWLDIHWLHPQPVGGDPIDIFAPDYRGRF